MNKEQHLTEFAFSQLDLADSLLKGLEENQFIFCTPIQAKTLPFSLKGQDIAGQAQTGTGKTAAYLLAVFQRLLTQPASEDRLPTQPRALIVAPTRELAVQIGQDSQRLGRHTGLRQIVVYGGLGYVKQRQQLEQGADILIGTPGRLIDYYRQRLFDFKAVQAVVLDEADRMFDLGFIKDIRYLLRRLPPPAQRLGLLFSATLSLRVTELAYEHLHHPRTIQIAPEQVTAEHVTQHCYLTANEEKIPLLIGLLQHHQSERALIFVNTKRTAEHVAGFLAGNGLKVGVLSGDVAQKKRLRLLQQFQKGSLPLLVATDVAARGLHIPDVSHVFNFDLPEDPQDYVHRIGRTARAGQHGEAISFACEHYAFSLPEIEQFIGIKLEILPIRAELLATVAADSYQPQTSDKAAKSGARFKQRRGRSTRRRAHQSPITTANNGKKSQTQQKPTNQDN